MIERLTGPLGALSRLSFTWRDAIDILAVALIAYTLLRLIRGTRRTDVDAVGTPHAFGFSVGLAKLNTDSLVTCVYSGPPRRPMASNATGSMRPFTKSDS